MKDKKKTTKYRECGEKKETTMQKVNNNKKEKNRKMQREYSGKDTKL